MTKPLNAENEQIETALAIPPGEERGDLLDGLLVHDEDPQTLVHQRSEYLQRVYLLMRMRWLAIAALLVTTMVSSVLGGYTFSMVPPGLVLVAMALYNVAFEIDFYFLDRKKLDVKGLGMLYRSAMIQIDLDLVALTCLIHFTGGIDSPFVLFYIFHTIIASYLLSRKETFLHSTLALGLFAIMCYLEYDPILLESLDWVILSHVSLYQYSELIISQLTGHAQNKSPDLHLS